MRAGGASCLLVSGGFLSFAEPVARTVGFDRVKANRLVFAGGKLSGEVGDPIVDAMAKREALIEARDAARARREDVLAIGDGANDKLMIEEAGLGIAFRAKPALVEVADAELKHHGLDALAVGPGRAPPRLVPRLTIWPATGKQALPSALHAACAAALLANGPTWSRVTTPDGHNNGLSPGQRALPDSLRYSASAEPRCEKAPSWIRQAPLAGRDGGRRLGRRLAAQAVGFGGLGRPWRGLAQPSACSGFGAGFCGGRRPARPSPWPCAQRDALLAVLDRQQLVELRRASPWPAPGPAPRRG